MATEKQILSKMRLIEKLLGINKSNELTLMTKTNNRLVKYAVATPFRMLTKFETRSELYNTLDLYVKGMEDYKNRIKLRKRY
jgi:hypothetical protein